MKQFLIIIFIIVITSAKAQFYFPPNDSNDWDTISTSSLGWCKTKIDDLYSFLDSKNTKSFILLKDGKILLEQYFNGHTSTSNWYWASAGKTLTAFMTGIAQQEDYLSITDTTSKYLGQGWTSGTSSQEEKITIKHQLKMTTGLDDGVSDPFCTTDTCLGYLSDAGTRWAYHNAPYTLLDKIIENATGLSFNKYLTQKLKNPIGMNGLFLSQDYNNVYYSNTRSMARFALLILNKGNWNGTQILNDTNYFNAMVNTSQSLNESYGYLWWLNGKSSYMVPQTQYVFSGSISPDAPDDMYAALGKNGQLINIIPSQGFVWIRMGDAPDNSLVPFSLNNDIWKYINDLNCSSLSVLDKDFKELNFSAFLSPNENLIYLHSEYNIDKTTSYSIYNSLGELIQKNQFEGNDYSIRIENNINGMYFIVLRNGNLKQIIKILR